MLTSLSIIVLLPLIITNVVSSSVTVLSPSGNIIKCNRGGCYDRFSFALKFYTLVELRFYNFIKFIQAVLAPQVIIVVFVIMASPDILYLHVCI